MKNTVLLSILFTAAIATGCAGMGGQSGSASGSAKPAAAASSDAEIVAKAKAALAADPELAGTKIEPSSTQGAVRLKGEIKTLALRKKVESIIRGINGVKSVDNQLIVTG